jgi:hypothetical protein
MHRASFVSRFLTPVGTVLAIMLSMLGVYFHLSLRIDVDALRAVVAFVSASLLFTSIGFGALYIYPLAFFRGASSAERIIACLVTPLVWNFKELVRVSEFFTIGETLYYGLNTAFLLSIFAALGQAGLCELLCRWRVSKRSEEPVKVFSPAPMLAVIAGVAATYFFLLWGRGVHFFYIYIQGYRAIFS